MLKRDSKEMDYKLVVRWKSPRKGDLLFNGLDTTLKFLINNEQILTYKPIKRPQTLLYKTLSAHGLRVSLLLNIEHTDIGLLTKGDHEAYIHDLGYF